MRVLFAVALIVPGIAGVTAAGAADPERWIPVFGKHHAQFRWLNSSWDANGGRGPAVRFLSAN